MQMILVSRFLINLRYHGTKEDLQTVPGQPASAMIFRVSTIQDIVEDLGQPLSHNDRSEDDDALRELASSASK